VWGVFPVLSCVALIGVVGGVVGGVLGLSLACIEDL
jgi:hypothetical protein